METSLRKSFAIQRRVIGALLMREVITRYGRHNIGFLWLFVEPMMFTLGVMGLWHLTGLGHGHGVSPTAFAVTGYSSVLLWRNTATRCVHCIEPNLALMHHRNVRVIDVMLSRILLELAGATASFVVLTTIFWLIGWMDLPVNILGVLRGWLMLFWFGASLGLTIGALSSQSEVVEKLWHPLTYLVFPLSGAVFLVDWLSPNLRPTVLWLPMVHGVEMLRGGFFGPVLRVHYDFSYFMCVCLGLTTIGLSQLRILGRKLTPE